MATNKTNPSAAIRSSLIAGARAAAPKYTGTKGLNINVGGLLGIAQKEAAKTAQLKQQLESQLGYMPDVTKVAENEAPILQDYFQTGKNQIADLHNELQYADPEQKREIMQQISQIENSAKAANGYLTKKAELATEFRDNIGNISKSMPENKLEKISAVLMGNDYKIEFNDYSGKPVYVLPDGSKIAHEELDDFYYKDSKTALAVNDYSNTYLEKGRSGKPLTTADINILKTKLGQSIDNEGSLNSLITDGLIEGMNFGTKLTDENIADLKKDPKYANADEFTIKRKLIVDEIAEHLQEVHKEGQNEYDKKQNPSGTENQGDFVNSFGTAPSINVGTKSNPERVFKRTDKDGKTYYVKVVEGVESDDAIKFYTVEDLQAYAG
jgi:hypothetical protein